MRVFFVFIYSFTTIFTLTCSSEPELRLIVNPPGHNYGSGPPLLVKKVDEPLNLTCRLVNHKQETIPDYNISWNWQYSMGTNANRVMVVSLSRNEANLVFQSLKETDSGEYTCKCTELDLYENVRVKVKAITIKKYCSEKMFHCSPNCIGKHFVCDGKPDCKFGEDEAYEHCGSNPCEGKIPCEEGRCIPLSWCCDEDHDPNCTVKVKPKCCHQLTRSYHEPAFTDQQFSDMGFLQTTIYTVIGCAMAFMFIVTILVIAICRVHLKRTVISRCPLSHQHLRPGSPLRPGLPLYDIDMFLDRHQDTHAGGLLVTYNINNGVQFVGRPIDPPPYCEVVDTPPREGPPPPYVSRENLAENPSENPINSPNTSVSNINVRTENNTSSRESINSVSESANESNLSNESVNQVRVTHVPPEVVSNLKGLTKQNVPKYEPRELQSSEFLSNNEPVRNHSISLSDDSKLASDKAQDSREARFDTCQSIPSVSGLSKFNPKPVKRIFSDFSDSESDSSCMENDALLTDSVQRKSSEGHLEIKSRSCSLSNSTEPTQNASSNSFINNIAAVSKSLIGSLSKRQTDSDSKLKKISPNNGRKTIRPLLTQKSFDSSDKGKDIAKNGNSGKTISTLTHSMGDLSPVSAELNYSDFDRREFLTLPLRESFIGVRNEET